VLDQWDKRPDVVVPLKKTPVKKAAVKKARAE
jgi:hypothetical protein